MSTLHDIWQHHYAGDFAAGVRLLADHGPHTVTRKIMQRLQMLAATGAYVGKYESDKLAAALHSIAAGDDDTLPPPAAKKTAAPTAPAAVPTSPEATTTEKAKALHKAQAYEHAQMVTADTDEQRAQHAIAIMEDIVPALDKEYDALRAGDQEPGQQTDEIAVHPILDLGDAKKLKRLQSVRSRISNIKKKLAQAQTPARKQELEKQLAENTAQKELLEKELG